MIDLEKFQEAQKLADDYYEQSGKQVLIELNFSFGCSTMPHKLWVNAVDYDYYSLDDLVRELERLNSQSLPTPTINNPGLDLSMQEHLEHIYLRLTALEMKGLNK